MTTTDQITDIVKQYAAQSDIFMTPQGTDDPITPKPAALPPHDQQKFFNTLLHALADAGVKAKLPFNALIACETWTQVRILIFHWQD